MEKEARRFIKLKTTVHSTIAAQCLIFPLGHAMQAHRNLQYSAVARDSSPGLCGLVRFVRGACARTLCAGCLCVRLVHTPPCQSRLFVLGVCAQGLCARCVRSLCAGFVRKVCAQGVCAHVSGRFVRIFFAKNFFL